MKRALKGCWGLHMGPQYTSPGHNSLPPVSLILSCWVMTKSLKGQFRGTPWDLCTLPQVKRVYSDNYDILVMRHDWSLQGSWGPHTDLSSLHQDSTPFIFEVVIGAHGDSVHYSKENKPVPMSLWHYYAEIWPGPQGPLGASHGDSVQYPKEKVSLWYSGAEI